MPSRFRAVRLAVALAVLAILPSFALAANKAHSFEIGGAFTFVRFDTQMELSSRIAPSLILGYNFTKRHGGEMVYTSTKATPDNSDHFDVDVDIIRLGYTFNSYPRENMTSAFRFGVGMVRTDPDPAVNPSNPLSGRDTNPFIYTGGTYRYFFSDRIAMRLAATIDLISRQGGLANGDVEATGELGLVFMLGGTDEVSESIAGLDQGSGD